MKKNRKINIRIQAHALAEGLFGKGIGVFYSSDLGRAVQTAEII